MSAVAAALGTALPAPAIALGFFGTFVVYNIDRLRDTVRDRATSPARTAFVERNRSQLIVLSAASTLASLAAAAMLPPSVSLLCAAVLALGLLHRRIKHLAGLKTAYITLAWVSVCVGVPALIGQLSARDSLATGLAIGMTIAANLIVSNIRDREGAVARLSGLPSGAAMGFALLLCLTASFACISEVFGLARGLAPVPAFEALAIAGFASSRARRDRERYGLAVVDGALLLGALAARFAIAWPIR